MTGTARSILSLAALAALAACAAPMTQIGTVTRELRGSEELSAPAAITRSCRHHGTRTRRCCRHLAYIVGDSTSTADSILTSEITTLGCAPSRVSQGARGEPVPR